MTRNVIIIGNSGSALESYSLLRDMLWFPCLRTIYNFKGFLSHKGYKGDLGEHASLEIGSDVDYTPQELDVFALGIGNNKIRYEAFKEMKAKGGEFINLVSPWAYIGPNVVIGEGNIIAIGTNFSDDIHFGDANYFNGNVRFGHDVHIGNANFFGQQSMVMGNVKIGDFNSFAPNSMIMEKAKIGNSNKIAPMSVIYKGCRDNCLMTGNPAIKMTTLEED